MTARKIAAGAVVVGILTGGGWLIWKKVLPEARANRIKNLPINQLVAERMKLTQNRIWWMGLNDLDPLDKQFGLKKNDYLAQLKQSCDELIKNSQKPTGTGEERLKELRKETRKTMEQEKNLLTKLNDWDKKVGKLWEYDARKDLDQATGAELAQKIDQAKQGIRKIEETVKDNNNTAQALAGVQAALRAGDKKGIYEAVERAKVTAWTEFTGIIRSTEGVKMLTEMTNIIYRYQYEETQSNKGK